MREASGTQKNPVRKKELSVIISKSQVGETQGGSTNNTPTSANSLCIDLTWDDSRNQSEKRKRQESPYYPLTPDNGNLQRKIVSVIKSLDEETKRLQKIIRDN